MLGMPSLYAVYTTQSRSCPIISPVGPQPHRIPLISHDRLPLIRFTCGLESSITGLLTVVNKETNFSSLNIQLWYFLLLRRTLSLLLLLHPLNIRRHLIRRSIPRDRPATHDQHASRIPRGDPQTPGVTRRSRRLHPLPRPCATVVIEEEIGAGCCVGDEDAVGGDGVVRG